MARGYRRGIRRVETSFGAPRSRNTGNARRGSRPVEAAAGRLSAADARIRAAVGAGKRLRRKLDDNLHAGAPECPATATGRFGQATEQNTARTSLPSAFRLSPFDGLPSHFRSGLASDAMTCCSTRRWPHARRSSHWRRLGLYRINCPLCMVQWLFRLLQQDAG